MTEYKIQSKNFLPDSIRDYDFYSRLTEILDYILDLYHTKNIDVLKALYDIKNSDFNSEKILELLGSEQFIDFGVEGEQLKTLCVLLSNLYEIKGTKRGLQYLLRLLDMDCNVYEWYDINRWYQEGDPKWTHPVDPCTVVIELGLEHRPIGVCDKYDKWALPRTGSPAEEMLGENQAFEDTEGKFRDFATQLLWICVSLTEIRWAKIFTDYVDISSTFAWESAEVFYDKYSPWVFNCPETMIVGFPVFQEFPYVGDPVNVGDYVYKEYPFVVRSIEEYNDPINYDGWLQTGFVGYSHQVISENIPLVGDSELYVGDKGYFWAWGYSESAQKEYLLWQRLLVGELWIEGDISPVGLNWVSGCQVSYIHTHTETAFENDYHVRRGIIVGYEDVVQPPDNTGDSHVVDDHQGDILEAVAITDGFIEEIPIDEITEQHKEVAYSSHISDIYEPFLVGDPTKFVGDTNLRVGQDYFFTWFEVSKELGFVEQFHTTCLQVGSWGHGYTEGTPYYLVVGQPDIVVSSTYFVGESVTPIEYKDRNPLLYTGTYLTVGSDNFVDPSVRIGQGFNYVGELAPWDNTDFVVNSNNIIYEWLESIISPEIIEEEIPVFEQLETSLSEYELSSNIRDSLWNKLVGASPVVGSVEYFTVGSIYPVGYGFVGEYLVGGTLEQQFIGNSPVVGYYDFIGTDYIAEDPYCKLTVDKEVNIAEERFVIEAPIVGDTSILVGYTGYIPIYIGSSVYKYLSVGDINLLVGYTSVVGSGREEISGTPHFVGDPIFVGQQEFISTVETYVSVSATGEIYTGKQNNIVSVFEIQIPEMFEEEILNISSEVSPNTHSIWTDFVFAGKNLIGQGNITPLNIISAPYLIGQGVINQYRVNDTPGDRVGDLIFVGVTEISVQQDQISILTVKTETSEIQDQILIDVPFVNQANSTIGAIYENPLLVGSFNTGTHFIGEKEYVLDADLYVNQDAYGRQYTGKELNVSTPLIQSQIEISIIEEEILAIDSTEITPEFSFEDKVFKNKIGDVTVSNTYFVSATDIVGSILVDPLFIIGGSSEGITVSLTYFIGQAEHNVEEDANTLLEIKVSSEIKQEQVYFNYPTIQPQFAGGTLLEEHSLSTLFVGNAIVGQTSFTTETPDISNSVIANSYLTCIIDEGEDSLQSFTDTESLNSDFSVDKYEELAFEQFQPNLIPNPDFILTEDGEILSHPIDSGIYPIYVATETGTLFVGYLETNPDNAIYSHLEHTVVEDFSEQFNVNEDIVPVVMGSEDSDVLILPPEGNETNPVYLTGEQTESYVYNSEFNPTNAINDSLFYLIDES